VKGITEKVLFLSVTVYNKHLSNQWNLLAQIEQVQYRILYE